MRKSILGIFLVVWAGAAEPGQPLQSLAGHRGAVRDLAFSADERWLASAGQDGQLCLWDWQGRRVQARAGSRAVEMVRFSADGKRLASLSAGVVSYWSLPGLRESSRMRVGPGKVAFSMDLLKVACLERGRLGYFGNGRSLWQTALYKEGEARRMACLAFRPDGLKLSLGGERWSAAAPSLPDESYAWEFDLARRKLDAGRPTHDVNTTQVCWAGDGSRSALAGRAHPDAPNGGWVQLQPGPEQAEWQTRPGLIEDLDLSPNGELLGVVDKEGAVWNVAGGRRWDLGPAQCLALGRSRAATGLADGRIRLWKVAD